MSLHSIFLCQHTVESICDALFEADFDADCSTYHPLQSHISALHVVVFSSVCKVLRTKIWRHALSEYGENTAFPTLKWMARTYIYDGRISTSTESMTDLQLIIHRINHIMTDLDVYEIPFSYERVNYGYDVEHKCVRGFLHFTIQFSRQVNFVIDLSNYSMFHQWYIGDRSPSLYKFIDLLEECTASYKKYDKSVLALSTFLNKK